MPPTGCYALMLYDKPIYASGQIELQNHGNTLYFKNIHVREVPR